MKPGLYEQIISRALEAQLKAYPEDCRDIETLENAEAPAALTQYIAESVRSAMDVLAEGEDGTAGQVGLANRILALLREVRSDPGDEIAGSAQQLRALIAADDPRHTASGMKAGDLPRPETSVAMSSLFTGAVHEPQLLSEFKKEIATADRIDMLVSFIKWSGLRQIMDALKEFTYSGKQLRVITTSYMGATDLKAVSELALLPNTSLKISYDTERTRLHAKSYIFYRDSGFTTAYVGSSNLSNPAITAGLEWNMKITAVDQPDILNKINATFETYWNSDTFEAYTSDQFSRLRDALSGESGRGVRDSRPLVFTIRPYPYQEQILARLAAERELRGHFRNLVVAATGTGKTVISAFDYLSFRTRNPHSKCRLLFVAHREEILRQAQSTYQGILQDPNFGELYLGGSDPADKDYLFASISSVNSRSLCGRLPADYYDYIVIDEFHRAAAPSYQLLLSYFRPKILLGLTATPERMDGKDILDYFDGRTAAEIRLPEAIEQKLLCPFQYFGVSDTVDLNELKWTRGGYDKTELSNIYTMTAEIADRRAAHILSSLERYATDMNDVKALGFCVSVRHAHYMADFFNAHGVASLALDADSDPALRASARKKLTDGTLKVLFVVDLYNEGVDIRPVNTVLFLRPTESLTVFLQQLGRGLRLCPGKECLTVLDFVGLANRSYNFEAKLGALLSYTRRSVREELERGFVSVPKGCCILLEKKARDAIFENLKQYCSRKSGLLMRLQDCRDAIGHVPSLHEFLEFSGTTLETVYARYSYARLLADAGLTENFSEDIEKAMTAAFPRFAAANSRSWLEFMIGILEHPAQTDLDAFTESQRRLFRMFYVTLCPASVPEWGGEEMRAVWQKVIDSCVMRAELIELLKYACDAIDIVGRGSGLPYECPLEVGCSYTRDQLFVALDYLSPGNVREGVKWLPDKQTDVLMVTLNKSDKDYSPTTMYSDYSINSTAFHWQSQSTTSETSATGQRYIHHAQMNTRVCMFIREYKKDRLGAAPYVFAGLCDYAGHTGSRPMSIIWKLRTPIPAKLLKASNKLAV